MEVLVVDDDPLFKLVNLPLLQLSHLLDHVVARNEHSLEVAGIRERLLVFDFGVEVRLAVVSWVVDGTLLLLLDVCLLSHVWHQKLV